MYMTEKKRGETQKTSRCENMRKWTTSLAVSIHRPSSRVRVDALRHARAVNSHLCAPVSMPKSIRQRCGVRKGRRLGPSDRHQLVARAEILIHILCVELAPRRRPSHTPAVISLQILARHLATLRLGGRSRSQQVSAAPPRTGWGMWRRGRRGPRARAHCEVGGGANIWRERMIRVCERGEGRERAVKCRTQYDVSVGVGTGGDANACEGCAPRALMRGKEGFGRGRG